MDNSTLALILSAALTVLGVVAAVALPKVLKAIKESADVAAAFGAALADGKITADEIAGFKIEVEEAKQAIKDLK